jgi:putative toxin-antitoxin system antitoxin component (TIGR02293 family)
MSKALNLMDPEVAYHRTDDTGVFGMINAVKSGIHFSSFSRLADHSPFSLNEWAAFLQLSERTMHRYYQQKKTFDPSSSEKIMELALLFNYGEKVLGSRENFYVWLQTEIPSLGNLQPKSLLDTRFGINLLKDELTRIEYGVFA